MIKYFLIEESPYRDKKYKIKINFDVFPNIKIKESGSYNIFPARLMGLSYPNYLRICRDVFKAEIIGKGNKYPIPYFIYNEELQNLIKLLNKKMELIMTIKNSQLSKEFENSWQQEYIEEFGKEPTYGIKRGDE